MTAQQTVGFVGLGDMGEPMALNLIGKGFDVTVFDLQPEHLNDAKSKGAHHTAGDEQSTLNDALFGHHNDHAAARGETGIIGAASASWRRIE